MQAQPALQRIGDHAGKGAQHGAAEEYGGGRGSEQPGTGGSRKQTVPHAAETGAERKGCDRRLLRDHPRESRAQGHQTRGRLLDDQSTQAGGDKAGCDFGRRGARSEIGLDRGGEPAARIWIGADRSDEERGCSLVGEYRFGESIAIGGTISASTRDFAHFGRTQPLDLRGALRLEEEPAAGKPRRHPLHAAPSRRPGDELDGERRETNWPGPAADPNPALADATQESR